MGFSLSVLYLSALRKGWDELTGFPPHLSTTGTNWNPDSRCGSRSRYSDWPMDRMWFVMYKCHYHSLIHICGAKLGASPCFWYRSRTLCLHLTTNNNVVSFIFYKHLYYKILIWKLTSKSSCQINILLLLNVILKSSATSLEPCSLMWIWMDPDAVTSIFLSDIKSIMLPWWQREIYESTESKGNI